MHLLNSLLEDYTVKEIMINAPSEIWIKKGEKLILTDIHFKNEEELMQVVQKIASLLGQTINESKPIMDTFLPDGSRVHIIIPPFAAKGITITIVKAIFDENISRTILKLI